MAHFSDIINDGIDSQPVSEKLRCLGAICEMIKLAKSHISNGLPQVVIVNLFVSLCADNLLDIGVLAICNTIQSSM